MVGYPFVEVRSRSDHLAPSLASSSPPFILSQLQTDFSGAEATPHSPYEQPAGGIAAVAMYCYGVGSR